MTNRYFLGIDCGTSGTKTILINNRGDIVSSAYRGYPLIKPGKYMVEQDANQWWNAVVETVRQCCGGIDKNQVKAMAISAQAGCVLPFKDGKPLDHALSWLDARAHSVAGQYLGRIGNEGIYRKTGWGISPGMSFPKIIWYKENKPKIYEESEKFLTTVDYINYMLTGEYVMDPGNASLTQCYNVLENKWDEEILDLIELDQSKLPILLDSGEKVGKLTKISADVLGLSQETLVISGSHDQYCVATGAGVFTPGDMLTATGTAWVNLAVTPKPVFDENCLLTPGRHAKRDVWGLLTSIPASGASMEWFNDNFGQRVYQDGSLTKESFSQIDSICEKRVEKESEVLFYPGQTNVGEKRASFIGLGLEHDRYDLFLAIMESIAFEVLIRVQEFEKLSGSIHTPIMTGGASRSTLWKSILASVLKKDIVAVNNPDMAAIGAAAIAAYGYGEYTNLEQSAEMIKAQRSIQQPNQQLVRKYEEKFIKYVEFRKQCQRPL